MIGVDLQGKTALITGGTKGIGLAAAHALAEAGAQVCLTYKWGSADLQKVAGDFESRGAPRPRFFEADAASEQDTGRLMDELSASTRTIDIFISNVSFALRTLSLADYKKRSLFKTLEYSTWPLVDYTRKIKERFGKYPKYVLAISSDGPDHFYPGYDFDLRRGVLFFHGAAGRPRGHRPHAGGMRQGGAGDVQRADGRGERPDHQR